MTFDDVGRARLCQQPPDLVRVLWSERDYVATAQHAKQLYLP